MRTFIILFLLLGSTSFAKPFNISVKTVTHQPKDVFIPNGFDNNDLSQIVIEGYYPNSCYQTGLLDFSVNTHEKTITINDTVYLHEQPVCARVLTKYTKVVNLGVLMEGSYKVLIGDKAGKYIERGTLGVKVATTASPDDYLYAPVDKIQRDQLSPHTVYLKGHFTNSCMSMDRVEVLTQVENKTIVFLPIAKWTPSKNCKTVTPGEEFSYPVSLPEAPSGKYLMHIRSLNGQSVNEIMNIL